MRARSNRWEMTLVVSLLVVVPAMQPVMAQTRLDVVFANSGQPGEVCLNDGGFTCFDIPGASGMLHGVAVGDVNHDGHDDAVFAAVGGPCPVCLWDGPGTFDCGTAIAAANATRDVALGDVNGDGVLDAVTAESVGADRVCVGNGAGSFSCAPIDAQATAAFAVALGDLNHDSRLDAVFALTGGPNRVCLGDGGGVFTCFSLSAGGDVSWDVALGDVNSDGNLDLVFANRSMGGGDSQNELCLGDGTGGFSCSFLGPELAETLSVALGDVDHDGDLDAVFGNLDQPNQLCLGDGSGAFGSWVCSNVSPDADRSTTTLLGDVDGDGVLDVVFSNSLLDRNQVCYGDGGGGFQCSDIGTGADDTEGAAFGVFRVAPAQASAIPALGNIGIALLVVMILTLGIAVLRGERFRERTHP